MDCACGDGFTVAITKDNLLYSWGRSDNGRLGQQGNAGGARNRAYPKPIFSALHRVASISCRHWNTIILAEQVLSSKVIQTKALSFSETASSGVFEEGKTTNSQQKQQNKAPFDEQMSTDSFKFVKDLKEYEDCLESSNTSIHQSSNSQSQNCQSSNSQSSNSKSTSESDVPPWLIDELENNEFIPMEQEQQQQQQISPRNVENNNGNSSDNNNHINSNNYNSDSNNNSNNRNNSENNENNISQNGEEEHSADVSWVEGSHGSHVMRCRECGSRNGSYLEIRLKQMELENTSLRKRMKEQEILIQTLERERDCYARSTDKLVQLTEGGPITSLF